MTTVLVRRSPRRPAPPIPTGDLTISAPPELPTGVGSRWWQLLVALPMLTGTLASAMMFAGRQGGAYSYLVGGIFGVSSLGMLATGFGTPGGLPKRAELVAARRDYLRHLAGMRARVRRVADAQRHGMFYRHPDPDLLWCVVDSHRLWERRADDGDFAVVRVGLGPQELATPLVPPATPPVTDLEPAAAGALHRFLNAYALVPGLPVAVSVCGFTRLYVTGDGERGRGLVRALLAQLTVFHSPEDLVVAACVSPERQEHWDYLKWLPHARHPTRSDALGPARLVVNSGPELDVLLDQVTGGRPRGRTGGVPGGPHVVVVLDGGEGPRDLAGVSLIDLHGAPPRVAERRTLVLSVAADGGLHGHGAEKIGPIGSADTLDPPAALALARQLSGLRPAAGADGAEHRVPAEAQLPELLDIADPAGFTPSSGWAVRPPRDRLRVPIGRCLDGRPVEIDLKESARGGMGPHGLLIGATGSGKSELLRTLVLGLAIRHGPEALNFVLIDFKGGATFASLDRLPHTAAVITNLVSELPLVDRMTDALNGELVRRQELLRRAGNHASLHDYERARERGAALDPLPVLLVVCDEFSELLAAKPEFIELFLQIGRLGRSLGVHLLLASQRLEEGRLRGLDGHLSYRIGLRTFSALESRSVLGVPDAYELPTAPGNGYLKHGTDPLVRFRTAYASGPFRPARPGGATRRDGCRVREFRLGSLPVLPEVPDGGTHPEPHPRSLLDVLVDGLAGAGPAAHRVWLPPLRQAATLDDLLGPLTVTAGHGLTTVDTATRGGRAVPVGLVDRPFEQRRDPLRVCLSGGTGHIAIVGGPQSGKSTLLRTVLCGLSLTHTPDGLRFYCLDFGGGGLSGLRDLPHVGIVAARQDRAAVRRTIGEMAAMLAERERDGTVDGPDVFLVVDGWSTIRGEYEDLEPVITDLATRGLSYRVHLMATASRWMDFRPGLRDLFGSRLELRLGDPADSLVSRQAAMNVPDGCPGRGITPEGLHFLAALPAVRSLPAAPRSSAGLRPVDPSAGDPRIGEAEAGKPQAGEGWADDAGVGDAGADDAGVGGAGLVAAVAAAWTGPPAPPIRMLPALVPYESIASAAGCGTPIGLAESDLRPVGLDFAAEPHLLVFGDRLSGKSSFLRALAVSLCRRYPPDQARIILIDYRRGLLGAVDGDHLIGYAGTAGQALTLVESVAGYMTDRLPGPDVTADQLRDRSWWSGPDCYLLVDDYDLVTAGTGNPMSPLLDHLAQARDVGLHLVLARRSGGAGRALYEPVIQRLRELSTPGLVLSADPEEGVLLGSVRSGPLPPGRAWLVTRRDGTRLVQLAQPPDPS